MGEMNVELVAVDRRIWSGTAERVIVRTVEGDIGILPGHAPLLAELQEGFAARILPVGGPEVSVALHGGFLAVTRRKVSILAEDAQLAGELDLAQARAAFEDARRHSEAQDSAELRRARAQLSALGHSV